MEFRNIRTFILAANERSFSKAAEELGYSQSNVSFQIQQLEQELGVRLFERTGRTVQLTQQGRQFLFYANEIQNLSEQAAASVKFSDGTAPESLGGTLRIGSIESIATALLPDLLAMFHMEHPNIKITVYTENRSALVERAKNNMVDLFFDLNHTIIDPMLKQKTLRKEEIVFLSSASEKWELAGQVPLEQLSRETFVLTESGESYRNELDRLLSENGLFISPIVEFGNPETIVRMVEKDVGLSFLPLFCIQEKILAKRLCIVKTDAPPVYMYSQILYHKNKWITPQMQVFLAFISHYFESSD